MRKICVPLDVILDGQPCLVVDVGSVGAGERADVTGEGIEHRPERELTGLTDRLDGPLLILYAWELNNNSVVAGDGDFGLLHLAEPFDSLGHYFDRYFEQIGIGSLWSGEDYGGAALEVEAQTWG